MKASVIDISHWQTVSPGFEPAKAEGIVGVIHKLTEGSSYVDDTVDARAFLAREADLLFGVYHFVRPGSMSQQAKFFVDTANKLNLDEDGELLYALDHEDPGVSLDQAIEFLIAVEEMTGKSPVLYSGHVLKEQLNNSTDPRIYDYRLWLAQYSSSPELPKGYDSYWLWQYTDKGQLPGIAPAVDLNQYFDDRVEDLIEDWSGGDMPEPEPEPGPEPDVPMFTTTITIVSESPIGVHVKHEERK